MTLKVKINLFVSTIELHLSGLIGKTSHTEMQEIRIFDFSLKIGYIDLKKWGE